MKILFYLPIITPWFFTHIVEPMLRALHDEAELHVMVAPLWQNTGLDGASLAPLSDLDHINWHVIEGEKPADFRMDAAGRLARIPERETAPYAYTGVQIVHPRLFDGAPDGAFSTNVMWNRAIAKKRLYGSRLDGVWIHVGTPQARDEAEKYLTALAPA